jgi:hypothetical protein
MGTNHLDLPILHEIREDRLCRFEAANPPVDVRRDRRGFKLSESR